MVVEEVEAEILLLEVLEVVEHIEAELLLVEMETHPAQVQHKDIMVVITLECNSTVQQEVVVHQKLEVMMMLLPQEMVVMELKMIL